MLKLGIKNTMVFIIFVIILLLYGSNIFYALNIKFFETPKEIINDFNKAENRAEDMLKDPLILAGEKIIPLLLENLKDKKMGKRRYVIDFLGDVSYKQSLNTLQPILRDHKEKDVYRGSALLSIYKIDNKLGKKLASKYINEKKYLGKISRDILDNSPYIHHKRSYLKAFLGVHQ